MQTFCYTQIDRFKRNRVRQVLSFALICVLFEVLSIVPGTAQATNQQPRAVNQPGAVNQLGAPQPCYLGGTGQMPAGQQYIQQTPGQPYGQQYMEQTPGQPYGQQYMEQTPGQSYGQQYMEQTPGQPYGQQYVEPTLAQPYGQQYMEQTPGQPYLQQTPGQPYTEQVPGQQYMEQTPGQQYMVQTPGQQYTGQAPGQQYMEQTPGQQYLQQAPAQPAMSAYQISIILQQDPEILLNLKNIAGQIYGVDPTMIPDNGVYNCIQQDPVFRSQVSAVLIGEGFAPNWQVTQAPPVRGVPYLQPRVEEQPSEVLREQPIPYWNYPSLYDLYSQILPASGRLRRFGSDTFELGTGNVNLLPMDLPVGPDYVLGPGDNLVVNMWGGASASLSRTVDRQGQIELPEAGTITIVGLTVAEAQAAIQRALSTQFQGEHVEISLGRVRTVRVYVVGDVQRPGAYNVSSLSTPLGALYAAGGPTSRGSLRTLKQYRGKELVREIDLYDFLLHGVQSDLERLQPGDTILVPPAGAQVSVAGMVRRPAIYELKGKEDLQDVFEPGRRCSGFRRSQGDQRCTGHSSPAPHHGERRGP